MDVEDTNITQHENDERTTPYQDRIDIAKSLFGILPQTSTLEEVREERGDKG